jgi:anaerobic selenocysteine-containing dehydrogenase
MSANSPNERQVHGYCSLCIARCGTVATVTDGRFARLDPDPTHPTGAAICAKGRAAPELVYHKDRLKRPLRRTRPKGDSDPGWEEISWDAALDETAAAMRRIAAQHGPEAVAFSHSSPSTTAIADSAAFVRRLMNAFGTPNQVSHLDLCGWGRGYATRYVFGVGSVATGSAGGAMADIAESGCLILWGYNPSFTRITHATATVAGLKRGMKLIVIDPRNVGLANKADVWLRVRPGTDGALALGLANIMIERGWYDQEFVRAWSNGPLLVRSDTDRLLKAEDLGSASGQGGFVAWDSRSSHAVSYDPSTGRYETSGEHLALRGEYSVATMDGPISCRPVFDRYAALCRKYSPDVIEATCWIPPRQFGGSCAHDLARPAGLLLRLEWARASRQQHRDGAGDGDALCADRQLRYGRWKCAVTCCTGPVNHRRRLACGKAACSRDRACRTPARTGALEPRWASGLLPRCPGTYPLSSSWAHRVRQQSAACPRRSCSGTCRARRARFLLPCRSVHDANGRACGHRAASGVLLRIRSPKGGI